MKTFKILVLPILAFALSGCSVNYDGLFHNHSLGEYEYDEEYHWKTCKDCHEQFLKEHHSFSNIVVEKEPTESEDGSSYQQCLVCEYKAYETLHSTGSIDKLVFTLNEEETCYSVKSVSYDISGDIYIPTYYKDLPVTSIEDEAFGGCDEVTKIFIPDTVKSIGQAAFAGCAKIKEFNIPTGVTQLGNNVFAGCAALKSITLPSIAAVPNQAFLKCLNLEEVKFNDNILKIGDHAFDGCAKLKSLDLPSNLSYIGKYAFNDCSSLTSVVLPNSLEEIDTYGFYQCNALHTITLGACMKTINYGAFNSCEHLYTVINGSSLDVQQGHSDNGNVSYFAKEVIAKGEESHVVHLNSFITYDDGVDTTLLYADKRIHSAFLGSGITKIAPNAFRDCKALEEVSLPDGLTSIGNSAFYGCEELRKIIIPNSVTSIGNNAFLNCYSLVSITLGSGLTEINNQAFANCYKLVEVINKSALTITKGGEDNGLVAYYAINVKNGDYYSDIYVGEKYVIYGGTTLVDYTGSSDVYLSEEITKIHSYAFTQREIREIHLPDTITLIEKRAFYNCYSLVRVFIEGSPVIEDYSFYDCFNLVSIINNSSLTITAGNSDNGQIARFAQEVTKYLNQSKLQIINNSYIYEGVLYGGGANAYIDPSVKKINSYAFYGNASIKELSLPSTLKTIDYKAFYGCTGLTTLHFPENLTASIDSFSGCTSLVSIRTTKSVDSSNYFRQCESIVSVVAQEGATGFYIDLSQNLVNIVHVQFPSTMTSFSLSNCAYIESVKVPEGVTSFSVLGCEALRELNVPSKVVNLNCQNCKNLKNINLPESLTAIVANAFSGCTSLEEAVLPNGITSIGDNAFTNCESIVEMIIPNSVVSIGKGAFFHCGKLSKVTIGENVSTIGNEAFKACLSLTSIIYKNTKAKWASISLGSNWAPTSLTTIICTDGNITL